MLSSPCNVRRAPFALGLSLVAASLVALAPADTLKATSMRVPGVLAEASIVGRVPGSTLMQMSMSLAPASRAALTAYANAVSDPRSKLYHQFLTPTQIGTKFGASASTVNKAVSFLKSSGMTITKIADNHMAILFKGTAGKVESAFATHLNLYADPSRKNGPKQFASYDAVPKVTSALAPFVVSIGGLQSAYVPLRLSTLTPALARVLYNSATLYGTKSARGTGHKGEGINIGISNFDGYSLQDALRFLSTFSANLSSAPLITKVSINGSDGEQVAPGGEGDLDIQMVLSNAPYCHLFIYDGSFTFSEQDYFVDYVAALTQEAQDNLVDIVTESYDFPTNASTQSFIVAAHDQHVAMTLEGITYLCASGDYGTDRTRGGQDGPETFDYPHIDPDTLQVGGTSATVDSLGNRTAEVGWKGSGGSYSSADYDFNVLPTYQVGPGVPTDINRRLFPDVAVHASGEDKSFSEYDAVDPTSPEYPLLFAFYIYTDGFLSEESGTSAASPLLAGELGIILQGLSARGLADVAPNGRSRFGRLNDFIYELGSTSSYSSAFFDVTSGDSGKLPDGINEAVAGPGWDFVTGWGAPNVQGFLDAYAATVNLALPPTAANIYSVNTSTTGGTTMLALGTNPSGAIPGAVTSTDGVSYTLQSVTQPGVGQVAAATMNFTVPGTPINVSLTASLMSPSKTSEFLYLYNYTSNSYDLVQTVAGNGAMTTISLNVDQSKYLSGGSLQLLARALKPTRLGNSSFTFSVDRATLRTRIAPQ